MVGATVNVEGTTVGCATDAEGYFELEVEESGTVILVFRSVGYSEVKKSVVVEDKKEAEEKEKAEKLERLPDLEKIQLYTDEILKVQIPQLKTKRLARFWRSLKMV